jgi:DNA-binding MarR family transcriptional regulator
VADAWGSVLRVQAALVPELDAHLRQRTGLPLRWYDVLLELSAAPGLRLRMSDLGARVVLSRTRASRVVDELESAGLVRREANAEDARSAFAVLTDAGLARFRAAAPIYVGAVAERFAALTDAELQTIVTALERVIE